MPLHSISTDLHALNVRHPVRDMATTMAKFLHLGMSLPEVIAASTIGPAKALGRDQETGPVTPFGRAAFAPPAALDPTRFSAPRILR